MSEIKRIELENTDEPLSQEDNESGAFRIPEIKNNMTEKIKTNWKTRLANKKNLKLILISGVLILLLISPFLYFLFASLSFKNQIKVLAATAETQNIDQIQVEMTNTKESLKRLTGAYKIISWTKFVPIVGKYSDDLGHGLTAAKYGFEAGEVLLEAIKPYSDVFGYSGSEVEQDGQQTAKDRMDFIVNSLPELEPKIGEISSKVQFANKELQHIDPYDYPEKISDINVRNEISKMLQLSEDITLFTTNGAPLLSEAPDILGMNGERNYLVIFQNDKELRPTGGFMTAYTIMNVNKATFNPSDSSDIYDLDSKYEPTIEAPEPIIKYIKGPYVLSPNLRLRDMNWSPDFKESMDLFTREAELAGIDDIDGVIAVDTEVLVKILDVIGPIGVSGFGNFSTEIVEECHCPQVIYELESFADVEGPIVWDPNTGEIVYRPPNSEDRKGIIGPLMNSIMANTLGQPKEKLPQLVQAGFSSMLEKHILFYMMENGEQEAFEKFGVAGTIKDYDGDYLHINNANLGGRKSNLYATHEVEQKLSISEDGSMEKTVVITYKNPKEHDGWLNSVLPNWVRVYVPRGSELIDFTGVEEKVDPYEELDKTVFAGYFRLRPQGVSKVSLTYKIPVKAEKDYKLLIQKQPGTDGPLHLIDVNGRIEEFTLKRDKELIIKL